MRRVKKLPLFPRLAVLLLAPLTIAACHRTDDKLAAVVRPTPPLSPIAITIAPGIHLLGELSPGAAYAVETSDGLVLIDTGMDRSAGAVKHQLEWLGLDWRRVRAILLTHGHGDHVGGAKNLRAATGAKVYIGSGDAAIVRAGGPREAFFSAVPMLGTDSPDPTTVDVEIGSDQIITVGDVRFQALTTPGHTPGSIVYLMERGGKQVLFSGDVIWSLTANTDAGSPMSRPLGTYATYLSPRYRGDAASYLTTLKRLRALPAPQMVLPGHPRNDTPPPSPLMTQEHWEALLDPGIREMEQLVARYRKDGANFLDGVPRKLLPDMYYLGDFKGVAVYGFFSSAKFFVVNAPGEQGISAFLREQLGKLGVAPVAPTAVLLTSGEPDEAAGMAELCRKGLPQLVAPKDAWEQLRHACPVGTRFLSAEDLPRQGWFVASTIPLSEHGGGPVAYLLAWGEKTVLVSGRTPLKPTESNMKTVVEDFKHRRRNTEDHFAASKRLAKVKPDLWLPAFPSDGQNAFLYGNDWRDVVQSFELAARMSGKSQ